MAPDDPPDKVKAAHALLEQGEFELACGAFEEAAAENVLDVPALVGWGIALARARGRQAAFDKLHELESREPARPHPYIAEARLLMRADRGPDDILKVLSQPGIDANAEFLTLWGQTLSALNRWDQARAKYESAIAMQDDFIAAYLGAGQSLLSLAGENEASNDARVRLANDAKARFETVARRLDPNNGAAFRGWAAACMHLDQHDEALQQIETAIHLDRDTPYILAQDYVDAGANLKEMALFAKALEAYESAVKIPPSFAAPPSYDHSTLQYVARAGAAECALQIEHGETALGHCQKALALFDDVEPGVHLQTDGLYFFAGVAQMQMKHYDDALKSLRSLADGALGLYAIGSAADVLVKQGKYREAWQELAAADGAYHRIAQDVSPDLEQDSRVAYASALLALNCHDKAIEKLKGVVESHPRNVQAWAMLMNARLELRERLDLRKQDDALQDGKLYWEARGAFVRASKLLEVQLEQRRSLHAVLGLGHLNLLMGEFGRAEVLLKEAIQLDSTSSRAHADLGIVYARRRDFAGAAEQLRLALIRDPDNLVLRCHLADAYFQLGHYDSALSEYGAVLSMAPSDVGAHIGRGDVLTELADKDELLYKDAEFHYTRALCLAQSMEPGTPLRDGSTRLGFRQWAALYYSRGYVRVKMYEVQASERSTKTLRQERKMLNSALADFEESEKKEIDTYRAKRAGDRVRRRLCAFYAKQAADVYGPWFVVAVSVLLLVFVQIVYLFGRDSAEHGIDNTYGAMTLGLLLFTVAGLYLPQVLKLKVAGLELEKSASDGDGVPVALNVQRERFTGDFHIMTSVELIRSRLVERMPGIPGLDALAGVNKMEKK